MGMVQTLYGVTTGGAENALAAVDIPRDGAVVGIDWAVRADLDGDGEFSQIQLSFGSTISNTNDARQVISNCVQQYAQAAAGPATSAINRFVPMDLPVAGGERLYIHSNGSAGVVVTFHCTIHYDFSEPRARGRRG